MDEKDTARRVIGAYLAEIARDARHSARLPRRGVVHLRERQRRVGMQRRTELSHPAGP